MTDRSGADAASARSRRLTLVACIAGSSIVFIDSSVITVALPSIERSLGGGLALQQWVVDAYLLTLGSLLLAGGSLADAFGGRTALLAGLVSFGLSSLVCALAWSPDALIAARAVQGIAGALLTPASLATLTETFAGEERGAAVGAWTAWTGIAFVVGPVLGGWLVSEATWRSIFFINPPLAAATLALVLVAVAPGRSEANRPHLDLFGGILAVAALGSAAFALIQAPSDGFADPAILAGLAAAVAAAAGFIVWEAHHSHPMLPLGLFRRANVAAANLETFVVYAGLSTLTFFLVLFLQQLAGYSPLRSGLALIPITLVMFVLSRSAGRLAMRLGPRLFMGAGPIVSAAALALITGLGRSFSYWGVLLPGLLVFALGLAATVAPLTATVLAQAGASDAGIASGVNTAVARVAGLLGIAVVGSAIAGRSDRLSLGGFHAAMGLTAGLLALGGLIGLVAIRNPAHPTMADSGQQSV